MNHMCGLSMGDEGPYRARVRHIERVHFSKDGMCAPYLRGCDNLDFGTADSPQCILDVGADKTIGTRYQNPRRHVVVDIIDADDA